MSVTWIRMIVPTLIMGGWLLWQRSDEFRLNNWKMWLASLLNALRMYLFFVGFIYATVSGAAIMIYTWPIFATILGFVFLKEQITALKILVLIMAFTGIVITNLDHDLSLDNRVFIGMLAALGSAFLYACSVIIFKAESKRYTTFEIVFFQNVIGAFIFLPFFLMASRMAQH